MIDQGDLLRPPGPEARGARIVDAGRWRDLLPGADVRGTPFPPPHLGQESTATGYLSSERSGAVPRVMQNRKSTTSARWRVMKITVDCETEEFTMAAMVKSELIAVRVTPEEAAMVRKAAAVEGQTVSEYVRACIITVRGIEGDPVAWSVIGKNFRAMVGEIFPIARRKKLA